MGGHRERRREKEKASKLRIPPQGERKEKTRQLLLELGGRGIRKYPPKKKISLRKYL